tara:strand:+ start:5020 stop:5469 length:450 start_codon:yes stop_codon:yes gene_type:complete
MDNITIDGVIVTPLKIIKHELGDILHGMKSSDNGFKRYGEAYFSKIKYGEIKGWNKHNSLVMNLIVPIGKVGFVIYDDRKSSQTVGEYFALDISNKNYKRLTVPQNLWVAFCGIGKDENIILNIASEEHDRNEVEKKGLDDIHFDWSCF